MYGYKTFHEKIMLDLINAARCGQSRHAYIFEGAEGLEIESSARLFAAALTCEGEIVPCGQCRVCKLSEAGTNPDIVTVMPKNKKKSIGVDDIREINTDASIKPFNSGKKVYIFPKAELITPEAQNSFLKTIEEPPEFAVFIFIIADAENLLQTVRSRCVTVRFPRVDDSVVRTYITENYPDCQNVDFLVRYADGIPKSIDSVIDDEEFDELRKNAFDALAKLMSKRKLNAYDAAEFLEMHKEKTELILELWMELVRDIILIQNECEALIVNTDFMPRLQKAAAVFEKSDTVRLQDMLVTAVKMKKRYVNVRSIALWLALGV